MPDGEVGGGHQNRYEPIGEVLYNRNQNVQYRKGPRREGTLRDKPPCWNAGTPVKLPDDVRSGTTIDGKLISVITEPIADGNGGLIAMLATRGADGRVTEYHPLIQFFNEVMAGIIRDGMTKDLDNLRGPTSASRLWRYLEQKYLTETDGPDLQNLLKLFYDAQLKEGLKELAEV